MIYQFTKDIDSDKLKFELATAGLASSRIDTVGTSVTIAYPSALTSEQETALNAVVAAHVKLTTVEALELHLDSSVFPFVKKLINTFAAENIAMGITQANKTANVLGIFTKKYPVDDPDFPICLKDTFDTGSLYAALQVLAYVRANEDLTGLSPYITDARIVILMNKIEGFLGLPLTT